jgi:hypothetical protein
MIKLKRLPEAGQTWRCAMNFDYTVFGVGRLEDSNEVVVIYRKSDAAPNDRYWIARMPNFCGRAKDGHYRFARVT